MIHTSKRTIYSIYFRNIFLLLSTLMISVLNLFKVIFLCMKRIHKIFTWLTLKMRVGTQDYSHFILKIMFKSKILLQSMKNKEKSVIPQQTIKAHLPLLKYNKVIKTQIWILLNYPKNNKKIAWNLKHKFKWKEALLKISSQILHLPATWALLANVYQMMAKSKLRLNVLSLTLQ